MTYEFAISCAWPAVVPVARRELQGFRLAPETVEDLIQEAAAVVLRKRPSFDSADDLAPYVRIVVRRLALHWLRDNRRESVGPVPDRPALHAVPDVVEGRMRLAGTVHAFNALEPEQRALLSEYIADRTSERAAAARGTSVKERKQVQRLRMAMARVADGFAAALGWLRLRFPWLEALPAQAVAIGVAVTALVSAFVPSSQASPPPTVAVSSGQGTAPSSVPEPAVSEHVDRVNPAAGRAPVDARSDRRDPAPVPTTGPGTKEVVRVEPPVGPPVGWERRPDSPEKGIVCMGAGVVACVPKEPVPPTPPLPSVRP